jgi:thiamine biosynthesis lipoprotein
MAASSAGGLGRMAASSAGGLGRMAASSAGGLGRMAASSAGDFGRAAADAFAASSRSRRAAAPAPAARWREVVVDHAAGTIRRPPGLRLDLGGSGKGHVADRVAALLAPARSWVVDCGGDVRLGGTHEVHVAHPLGGAPAARWTLTDTAVATSSVVRRAWRGDDGAPRHHLLDPATGEPAWSGVLAATALAPTALEAETLAKVALLRGTDAALAHGGLVIRADDAGRVREVAA